MYQVHSLHTTQALTFFRQVVYSNKSLISSTVNNKKNVSHKINSFVFSIQLAYLITCTCLWSKIKQILNISLLSVFRLLVYLPFFYLHTYLLACSKINLKYPYFLAPGSLLTNNSPVNNQTKYFVFRIQLAYLLVLAYSQKSKNSLLSVFRQLVWVNVREENRLELVLVRDVVAEVVDVRVNLKSY